MRYSAPSTAPDHWSAGDYVHNAGFVSALGGPVLDLLGPVDGVSVLDLGCGEGELAVTLAERGARVVGIDTSPDMIAAARRRGVDAHLSDGQAFDSVIAGRAPFDAVFSNAALHWMRDGDAVLREVSAVLRPGGRFVGEAGGHGNIAAIATALLAALHAEGIDGTARWPWRFATATAWRHSLEQHGFEVETCTLIPRPTPLPTGIGGWLRTFAGPFLTDLDESTLQRVLATTEQLLAPSLCDERGHWSADYVRLRFAATRR